MSDESLEACLPAQLRGPSTTITRVAAGLSGAGVHRVETGGEAFLLKVSAETEPLEAWRRKVGVQRLASAAGLAPRVIHVDEARRAVTSVFVVDRSFPARFATPGTRDAALVQLGRMLRQVHELPIPPGAEPSDPRGLLRTVAATLTEGFAVPGFVGEAIARVLAEEPPESERALVLSHNDVNPSNLVYDGEHVLLVDWDTAAPNEPFFDLAAIAVFLRMDDATCQGLLAAHDAAPVGALPARFQYDRRLVAVLCGAMFLGLARLDGHPGATGGETLDGTPRLIEVYQQMRGVGLASPAGKWAFGLALVKAGAVAG